MHKINYNYEDKKSTCIWKILNVDAMDIIYKIMLAIMLKLIIIFQ